MVSIKDLTNEELHRARASVNAKIEDLRSKLVRCANDHNRKFKSKSKRDVRYKQGRDKVGRTYVHFMSMRKELDALHIQRNEVVYEIRQRTRNGAM